MESAESPSSGDKVYALKSGGGICLYCMCGMHEDCTREPGMARGQCRCALEGHR